MAGYVAVAAAAAAAGVCFCASTERADRIKTVQRFLGFPPLAQEKNIMRTTATIRPMAIIICLATVLLGFSPHAKAQAQRDSGGMRSSDLLALQVYAVGGAFFPFGASGTVSGLDATDPTNLATSSQSGGTSSVLPIVGARVHVPMLWYMRDVDRVGFSVFFETGLQTSFGAQSFLQTFQNTSPNAMDFGTNTVSGYFQVPLLAGVTVPVGDRAGFLFDLYGGITIDSWSLTVQGAEANAPGQQGFFQSNRMITADPTIGLGLRAPFAEIADGFPLILGVNAELQFRPGTSVSAFSNNFPVTYTGAVGPQANLAIMARIGIAFGGR